MRRAAIVLPAFAAAWLLLAALGFSAGSRSAAGPGGAEEDLRARRAELDDLRRQIAEKQREIERLRGEGRNVAALLAELERDRVVTERYVATLTLQERALDEDVTRRRAELAHQERELARTRETLGAALLRFYKEKRVSAAELLVSAESFSEIFARGYYWARAVQRLRSHVEDLEQQEEALRRGIREVEVRQSEVLAVRREREEHARRLRQQEAARREDGRELERAIARHEEQARKLTAAQERIEELIAAALRGGGAGDGLEAMRGRLPWPVRGEVTQPFGTHVHPRYGTRVRYQGVAIAAPEGTTIRAAAAGRVVFVGWIDGYGKTVILEHGQGYFTLYAHAAQTSVGHGESVRGGQEIARVGSTESLSGASLHFEIRKGAQALDPADWLE